MDLLKNYKEKKPEIVFEWNDTETDARGWVVINSLRNGAAGGGTRIRKGLEMSEVLSLSKVMEIKFTVSGPPIGGAKSGINFDPADPRKDAVLRRWFAAVKPLLKNYYGTGGDLNVDEIKEVIPITEDYGIWHPQEGIVNGFFQPTESEKIHLIGQLRAGVSKLLEDPLYTPDPDPANKILVADMITGYGVAEAAKHFYSIFKDTKLKDKRVIVQGFGNVAAAAAYYLAQEGAKIVGIIDRDGGIIDEKGMGFAEVKELFLNRNGNRLDSDRMVPFAEINQKIWDVRADLFIPAAASRLVAKNHIEKLLSNGLEAISCGANVPFSDEDVFYGKTAKFTDNNCSLIPDFIANCGMARVFAYLMSARNVEISDPAIFQDVSGIIREALEEIHDINSSGHKIAETALFIALNKIGMSEPVMS